MKDEALDSWEYNIDITNVVKINPCCDGLFSGFWVCAPQYFSGGVIKAPTMCLSILNFRFYQFLLILIFLFT